MRGDDQAKVRTGPGGKAVPGGLRHRLVRGLATGAAAAVIATLLWFFRIFNPWEALTWDWRSSVLARPGSATDRVCVVLVDQNSLDWALKENGLSWPWPREVYGVLVDYLARHGAAGVTFDVLFTEPSGYGVPDDERFSEALQRFGRGTVAASVGANAGSAIQLPPALVSKTFLLSKSADAPAGLLPHFTRAALPVAAIAESAALLANVHFEPDADGVFRRVIAAGEFDGHVFAAAGLAGWIAGNPGVTGRLERGGLRIGDGFVPLDRTGHALLRFRGPSGTHRTFSAASVIQSELREREGLTPVIADPEVFRGKYVFFGFSAPGLQDLHPAPTDRSYPGVEIHATLLDNFLARDFMRTAPPWAGLATAAGIALLTGAAVSSVSSVGGAIAIALALMAMPVGIAFGAYLRGFWLPIVYPLASAGCALFFTLAGNYLSEGRQKRFIKSAFSHYLSPEVIEELLANPALLKLGGERKTLSIFFSDLQGFTSLSERLDPEQLTSLLNDYLTAMTEIIIEEGGTVDKYEGDAIIAFWNAPVERADHALRAMRTALRCQAKLAELREGFRARSGVDLFMRVGINTGPAVVGNVGSRNRFDYSMLGDAVNLASRLEGANKQFGTYTMVSEATWELVKESFRARELGRIAVVGKTIAVRVFEPFPAADAPGRAERDAAFAAGLALFYQGRVAEAAAIFRQTAGSDPAASAYVKRCEMLASQGAPCDGVWQLFSKG